MTENTSQKKRTSARPFAAQKKPARTKKAEPQTPSTFEGERIAKYLARAGIASRREAEKLIEAGRVSVDGKALTSPAVNIAPTQDIRVDGEPVAPPQETRVWRFHKKPGTLTTNKDPEGRATIFDHLPADLPRVVTVGRLDFNTEGLLLLTNDGALARHLELPANAWLRHYRVRVHGKIVPARLKKLAEPFVIEGIKYEPMKIEVENSKEEGSNQWLRVSIREGKNREVRKALSFIGLDVTRLIRVAFGPFLLGKLQRGALEEIPTRVLKDQLGSFFKEPKSKS